MEDSFSKGMSTSSDTPSIYSLEYYICIKYYNTPIHIHYLALSSLASYYNELKFLLRLRRALWLLSGGRVVEEVRSLLQG